jgi:hypothetical protein
MDLLSERFSDIGYICDRALKSSQCLNHDGLIEMWTLKDAAEVWGEDTKYVARIISRISGAKQYIVGSGKVWLVPAGSKKTTSRRSGRNKTI